MRYISLFLKDGSSFAIDESEEETIYNTMSKTSATHLPLKFAWSDTVAMIAISEIQGWWLSTPEHREAHREWERELNAELPSFE